VSRIERVGPVSYVHLDAGRPLTAAVTTASAEELGLGSGTAVVVTVKATAIHLV
jgi:molybdopterin-binding protein